MISSHAKRLPAIWKRRNRIVFHSSVSCSILGHYGNKAFHRHSDRFINRKLFSADQVNAIKLHRIVSEYWNFIGNFCSYESRLLTASGQSSFCVLHVTARVSLRDWAGIHIRTGDKSASFVVCWQAQFPSFQASGEKSTHIHSSSLLSRRVQKFVNFARFVQWSC